MQRELWRRMAFNALCGNGDDHPRNHGVRYVDGAWELAPAFDVSPYVRFEGRLAMRVTRDGHSDATRWALLRNCESFQVTEEDAGAYLDTATGLLTSTWESERARLGFEARDAPTPTPEAWLGAAPPESLPAKRYPRVRHRNH
jgi:serine/threonine-protein kinase HipA